MFMLLTPDPWNPNLIDFNLDTHEHRIYSSSNSELYAVVDYDDWLHFSKWSWKPGVSLRGKVYLRRSGSFRVNGTRVSPSIYLHIEIQKRKGVEPPSTEHRIVDHRNGFSLDCRKSNLRWATRSMNARNVMGIYAHDLIEG